MMSGGVAAWATRPYQAVAAMGTPASVSVFSCGKALQRCEAVGLLPAGVGVGAANAYRELRRVQHKARLDEQSTALDAEAAAPLAAHRAAVQALWRAVFGGME